MKADVLALGEVGFRDDAILDICQVVSHFCFTNRLADGLVVEKVPVGTGATRPAGLYLLDRLGPAA
jgi:hypothetical protein